MAQDGNAIIDHGQSKWSDLWKKEDFLSIWLGFAIIVVCMIAYFSFGPKAEFVEKIKAANEIQMAESAKASFKTTGWYKAQDDKGRLKASGSAFGKFISHWTKTPGSWKTNPMDAFVRNAEQAKTLDEKEMPKYEKAKAANDAALALAVTAENENTCESFLIASNCFDDWKSVFALKMKGLFHAITKRFNR